MPQPRRKGPPPIPEHLRKKPAEEKVEYGEFDLQQGNPFAAPGIQQELHDAVEQIKDPTYEPRLIGKGGEHMVFEMQDAKASGKKRSIVYKVNFYQTIPMLYLERKRGQQNHELEIAQKKAIEDMETKQLRRMEEIRELQKYFGRAAVPATRLMVKEVPISKDVVQKVAGEYVKDIDLGQLPPTIPAWVSVQKRLEMPKEQTVSLNGYYAEAKSGLMKGKHPEAEADVYDAGHDLLVKGLDTEFPQEDRADLVQMMFPALSDVASRVEKDPEFKQKLQEVARKLITYTQDTKTALDLAGAMNVVLIKGEKGWELKLPDALPPGDFKVSHVTQAIDLLQEGRVLNKGELVHVQNALNTIRVINALAVLSGIPERLKVPGANRVSAEEWRRMLMRIQPSTESEKETVKGSKKKKVA